MRNLYVENASETVKLDEVPVKSQAWRFRFGHMQDLERKNFR